MVQFQSGPIQSSFSLCEKLKTVETLRKHHRHDFVKGARMGPFECLVYVI